MVKNPPTNVGDASWIPGLERFTGGGNGKTRQYSCLGNPMDRGACWATVHEVAKSQTHLRDCAHTHSCFNSPQMETISSSPVEG